MTSYCDYCNPHPENAYNRIYHDTQYGFPLKDDNLLFDDSLDCTTAELSEFVN